MFASRQETLMLDGIMLAMGLAFFALSVGYAVACDRL
jgi:SNF family Na+-dependent transporter